MTKHHSNKHVGDAEELKQKRLRIIHRQHIIVKILFFLMCIAAICLTIFAIWAYFIDLKNHTDTY